MLLPLVWGLLRAYAENDPDIQEQYDWKIPFFRPDDINTIDKSIENPNVMGFSCYIWNWSNHNAIAKKVKERFPECLIVFGGPQVPKDAVDIFENYPWIDIVVYGEGEQAFTEILKARRHGSYDQIKGIGINKGGKLIKTPERPRAIRELELPSAYIGRYYDDIIDQLNIEGVHWTALLETNRGCPYSCTFCDWGSATKSRISTFPMKRVNDELSYLAMKGVTTIAVTDANFGILPRDLKIAEKVVELKKTYQSPQYFYVQMSKGGSNNSLQIAKLLADHHLTFGVTLSLQSTNPKTLKSIKRENLANDKFQSLQKFANANKIPTYTELIIPLPDETFESFLESLDCCLREGIDELRIYQLSLLPNAELSSESSRNRYGLKSKWVLLPRNVSLENIETKNEFIEIVYETNTMTFRDLVESWIIGGAVQVFHVGYWLRFITEYVCRSKQIKTIDFYQSLVSFYREKDTSMVWKCLAVYQKMAERLEVRVEHEMDGKIWNIYPFQKCSFIIENNRTQFYGEIHQFVTEKYQLSLPLDLLEFQSDMIVKHTDNLENKISYSYDVDWFDYFTNRDLLSPVKKPITVTFENLNFGLDNDKFKMGSINEWLRVAVGLGKYRFNSLSLVNKITELNTR